MTQTISTGEPDPAAEPERRVGIALSGGGVRSAAFSFGALQALQAELELVHGPKHAMFLSAVSGGSYTGAAILMAAGGVLNTPSSSVPGHRWEVAEGDPDPDGHPRFLDEDRNKLWVQLLQGNSKRSTQWTSVPASDPLRAGSTESDYLRVHARYLLEVSPLTTIFQFGWLMVISVLTVMSIAITCGWIAGLVWGLTGASLTAKLLVVGLVVTTAYVSWLIATDETNTRVREAGEARQREILGRELVVACGWVLLAGAFAVAYDANSGVIGDWLGASHDRSLPKVLAVGLGGSSVLGPALIGLVRAQLAPKADATSRSSRLTSVVRRLLIVAIEVLLAILVPLTLLCAFLLGWLRPVIELPDDGSISIVTIAIWILFIVLVIASTLGDGALSPHALYRNRLSRAFSMIRQKETAARTVNPLTGEPIIRERTRTRLVQPRLSALAGVPEIPELLISASVNITESGIAAAGSYARPIIFSPTDIYLAGEPGGSVETAKYERTIGRQGGMRTSTRGWFGHSFDGTVMSYVALTGAAVSPSMGKYTKYWLRAVLSLLNLRLGTWIPNPASPEVAELVEAGEYVPHLNHCPGPLLRLREFRGRHYVRARHIYVSDGGHYENLGIVELIRRGCDEVWAIDASDDDRGTWRTLSESLNLIASELGCTVTGDFTAFERPPAPAQDAPPVDPRLINETYADVHVTGLRDGEQYAAVIHVVKLGMSAETNPVVAQLGTKYRKFPYDSTLNQLYTAERFDLYRALGYDSTSRAVAAISTPDPTVGLPPESPMPLSGRWTIELDDPTD